MITNSSSSGVCLMFSQVYMFNTSMWVQLFLTHQIQVLCGIKLVMQQKTYCEIQWLQRVAMVNFVVKTQFLFICTNDIYMLLLPINMSINVMPSSFAVLHWKRPPIR